MARTNKLLNTFEGGDGDGVVPLTARELHLPNLLRAYTRS